MLWSSVLKKMRTYISLTQHIAFLHITGNHFLIPMTGGKKKPAKSISCFLCDTGHERDFFFTLFYRLFTLLKTVCHLRLINLSR